MVSGLMIMSRYKLNTMPHTSPLTETEEIEGAGGGLRGSPSEQSLDDFLIDMHGNSSHSDMPPVQWLKDTFKTKSARIRYLYQQGFTLKQIQQHLQLRPQHVRNVLTTALKRGPNEGFNLSDGQAVASINQVPLLTKKEVVQHLVTSIDNILSTLDNQPTQELPIPNYTTDINIDVVVDIDKKDR